VRTRLRATVELVLAAAAAIGCVVCWLAAGSTADVAPITSGEPSKTATVYDPGLITLSLFLATVAGVLVVLGVTRLRRSP
jgi:hypothetical protein